MRIDGAALSIGSANRSRERKLGSGTQFSLGGASDKARATAKAPVSAATGIDAILALQSVEDPLYAKKKKALKRGRSLLDVLDEMKTDLLAGQMNAGRLQHLLAVLNQARERTEPGLDALVADIELRARVELAKHGVYAPN